MRSSRSMATVSKARRIMGYSSSTSLKWSTESEKRRQYVSARTLAVRLPLVSRQISAEVGGGGVGGWEQTSQSKDLTMRNEC